jgi:cell division transport system permease protein
MFSTSTRRRAMRGLVREWRLHVLSICSLIVAFACLGAALLAVVNLSAIEQRWAHAGRASVYLKDNANERDVQALHDALLLVPHIAGVRYVSSAEARTEFGKREMEMHGELAGLPVDAFPSSLEIDVAQDLTDAELADIVHKMRELPSVDDVETYRSWTDRLAKLLSGGVMASAVLSCVVLGAVLAVVGSTMRLALQRRRIEVEVLKFVGATDDFVRKPFVLEGFVEGGAGALGAVVLLASLFLLVRGRVDVEIAGLVGMAPTFLPWPIAFGMVALGAVLGALAALLSVRTLGAS